MTNATDNGRVRGIIGSRILSSTASNQGGLCLADHDLTAETSPLAIAIGNAVVEQAKTDPRTETKLRAAGRNTAAVPEGTS
jgi:hypothetical protein